jgi:hypothetical protein
MVRTARRTLVLFTLLALSMTLQLAGASSASAATTCRHYDGWYGSDGLLHRNVDICAAPAADYPTYSGWGRVVQTYSTNPSVCGFSLFPYDIDEPRPMMACIAMMPAPVEAWRWTGSTWVKATGLDIGSSAYFAPYATGWRWAWTQGSGWVAIQQSHAAFRWYG